VLVCVDLVVLAVDLALVGAVVGQPDVADRQAPRVRRLIVSHRHARVADERKQTDRQRVDHARPPPDHLQPETNPRS